MSKTHSLQLNVTFLLETTQSLTCCTNTAISIYDTSSLNFIYTSINSE